jgi:hypothetical protein
VIQDWTAVANNVWRRIMTSGTWTVQSSPNAYPPDQQAGHPNAIHTWWYKLDLDKNWMLGEPTLLQTIRFLEAMDGPLDPPDVPKETELRSCHSCGGTTKKHAIGCTITRHHLR